MTGGKLCENENQKKWSQCHAAKESSQTLQKFNLEPGKSVNHG